MKSYQFKTNIGGIDYSFLEYAESIEGAVKKFKQREELKFISEKELKNSVREIEEKMRLNLGCGNDIKEGYINHDIKKHRPEIDIVFDLNGKKWDDGWNERLGCWQDPGIIIENEFEEIRAWDVLEHLDDVINFFNNCWNLLKEDGILDLKVCGWQNPNAHVDITHKRPGFDIRSFDYFVLDTAISKEYNYYTDKKWKYLDGYPIYDRHKNIIVKMSPIK